MNLKIVAGFVLASLMALPAHAAELKVMVNGVRSDNGAVMIGLYDSAENFKDAVVKASSIGLLRDRGRLVGVTMRARSGPQRIGFMDLPPGQYAVIVIHDEDDDGQLNKNALGIPTEGYAFSNDARGFLSAPSFKAAAVTVGDKDQSISISLVY